MRRLFIANRGEIAVRIALTAADLGVTTVGVRSQDDGGSLHVRRVDEVVGLDAAGPAAYLDASAIVRAASDSGCDALHPGYGFLSENADLARRCADAGIAFVGPRPDVLETFGDKGRARALATDLGVRIAPGTPTGLSLKDARAFLREHAPHPVLLKASAGGGGRGMRVVQSEDELASAWERCTSEAIAAFGDGTLYAEVFVEPARHVEVQVVGDLHGDVRSLGTRDCSLQRRRQKVLELAPALGLDQQVESEIVEAALLLARRAGVTSLCTFEFLVGVTVGGGWSFMEANPRLQVEHTVTEQVTGVDLVATQLRISDGAALASVLPDEPSGAAVAVELRINAERLAPNGDVLPTGGTVTSLDLPAGRGVRVDGCAYTGYTVNPRFDSLLAKVIVSADGGITDAVIRAARALDELRIGGTATNASFLRRLLALPEVRTGEWSTTLIDRHWAELTVPDESADDLNVEHPQALDLVDTDEPAVVAPSGGAVVSILVAVGDLVARGTPIAVLEAMKMEQEVFADRPGKVSAVVAQVNQTVGEGEPIIRIVETEDVADAIAEVVAIDLERIGPKLGEVLARHELVLDPARPDATEKRHGRGARTVRENVGDLVDDGSFVEYYPLVVAAQAARRSMDELLRVSPADGLVTGFGTVNADTFGPDRSQCAVVAYDYTVFAGTQGHRNHRKHDRLFELAERRRVPLVLFAEGGGGRPGDTDGFTGMDNMTFRSFGRLSGHVPLVGITAGNCFAGNAALIGCCDVVIAAEGSSLGIGGPAMIEGGGLGRYTPPEVGPLSVQATNGVVDIVVPDEAAGVAAAKRYLAYFQGDLGDWDLADQRVLRQLVPENRKRSYDVRRVIESLCDTGSVMEFRPRFGEGMVTAFARIEGRPVGVIANNPAYLAGAITSDGADKAARFLELCDAFAIPIVFLCDTPGIMVGPDAEKTAIIRHAARLFVSSAGITTPCFTVILRKAYGLGAMAMAAGSFRASDFTISWPTGELGGMGFEGAVALAYRRELAAIADPQERQVFFDEHVAAMYADGSALNRATTRTEIDEVIDPADTRRWLAMGIRNARSGRTGEPRRNGISTW